MLLIIIGLIALIALIISIYSLVLTLNRNTNEIRALYAVAAVPDVDAAVATTSNSSLCVEVPEFLVRSDNWHAIGLCFKSNDQLSIFDLDAGRMSELHGRYRSHTTCWLHCVDQRL